MNLSQEPLRVKLIATYYAFVLKDTGIKKKYYFIKSHSTVSLALVTNVCLSCMCFSVKTLLVSEEQRQTDCVYCMPRFEINRICEYSFIS